MKKLLMICLIGVAVAISILLFGGQNETMILAEYPRATGSSSPINTDPASPAESVPASHKSMDILLINASHPLPQSYKPADLINLYDQRSRRFQLAQSDIELCETAYNAMESMFSAAMNDGVGGFIITSGYRSFDKQEEVFGSTADGTAARPGTSEHESGLAFDVTAYGNRNFELTPQFKWLSKHCGEYGFILRYPKGKEDITGYPYEPWHYRYVGTPFAEAIMDGGIALEEYLEQH